MLVSRQLRYCDTDIDLMDIAKWVSGRREGYALFKPDTSSMELDDEFSL